MSISPLTLPSPPGFEMPLRLDLSISIIMSPPRTLETADRFLGSLAAYILLAIDWPGATPGNIVPRLVALLEDVDGPTENNARSCASVSRISVVMSWFRSRALAKIFGGGKL
jgi:hypothetical protein